LIFYIIGSLYRIQVDESNLPVAFLKVAPGAVFLRQFSVLGLHLASNSLWFDPDLWTCFGLAFRENSLSHLKCAINHPTGYNRPSQNFFEHGSVHDNDNDNQCLKKQSLKRIGLNCLKRNIWVLPKIWGFPQIIHSKKGVSVINQPIHFGVTLPRWSDQGLSMGGLFGELISVDWSRIAVFSHTIHVWYIYLYLP